MIRKGKVSNEKKIADDIKTNNDIFQHGRTKGQ